MSTEASSSQKLGPTVVLHNVDMAEVLRNFQITRGFKQDPHETSFGGSVHWVSPCSANLYAYTIHKGGA